MNRRNRLTVTITTLTRILAAPIALLFLHPFTAYLINAILDGCDGPVYKHILKFDPQEAQRRDKLLDLWLYTTAVIYNLLNPQWFTPILIGLYLYRLAGQLLFFGTKNRQVLIFFPNLFEIAFFYFYFPYLHLISPPIKILILAVLIITIIIHEISLHIYHLTFFDNLLKPTLKKLKEKCHFERNEV